MLQQTFSLHGTLIFVTIELWKIFLFFLLFLHAFAIKNETIINWMQWLQLMWHFQFPLVPRNHSQYSVASCLFYRFNFLLEIILARNFLLFRQRSSIYLLKHVMQIAVSKKTKHLLCPLLLSSTNYYAFVKK